MKKIIKILSFIFIAIIFSLLLSDRVQAKKVNCSDYYEDKDECESNYCIWEGYTSCKAWSCHDYDAYPNICNDNAGKIDSYGNICEVVSLDNNPDGNVMCGGKRFAKSCEEYASSGLECPIVDDYNRVCSKGSGTCTTGPKAKTCEDYGSVSHNGHCPSVDDYGRMTCGIDSDNNCVSVRVAYTCGSGPYRRDYCDGKKDDFGNTCKLHAGACSIAVYASGKVSAQKIFTCKDIYVADCNGILDSYGNLCEPENGTNCGIGKETNLPTEIEKQTTAFLCEEFDTFKGARECPIVDSYGNSCYPNDETKTCYHPENGKIYDFTYEDLYLSKKIKDYSLTATDETFKCSDVIFLTGVYMLIRIVAPFLVILLGSLDFFRSMMQNDEKKMKESQGKFVKRIIAFVLLIVLPFVVQFVFEKIGTFGSDNMCLVKCVVSNNTTEKGCD